MKRRFRFLRIVILTIAGLLSSELHADVRRVEKNGVVYETTIYPNCAGVLDILPEAGTDVHILEKVMIGNKEYTVNDWLPTRKVYPEGIENPGYGSATAWIEWSNKKIRSLHLPKTMPIFTIYDEDEYHLKVAEFCESCLSNLEEITIDPASKWYVNYEGAVYLSDGDNKYHSLAFVPRLHAKNGTINIHPSTKIIISESIGPNKKVEYLTIPESVEYIEDEIKGLQSLKKISFENWAKLRNSTYLRDGLDIESNKNLREVCWKGSDRSDNSEYEISCTPYFWKNPKLVKLPPFIGIEVLHGTLPEYEESRIMFLDFPDLRRIKTVHTYPHELGDPYTVRIGSPKHLEQSDYEISYRWLNPDTPTTLCLYACTPPSILYQECFEKDLSYEEVEKWHKEVGIPRKWTVYVPAESVSAYENDRYWGAMGRYYPITDKLIPLVSEPELEIKPGMTHEYLWDVMPLGDAVAAERGEWTSDDTSVATVDEDGVLTAVSLGEATITFTLADTEGNLYTAESKVSVVKELSGVEEIEEEPVAVAPEMSVPDGVYDLHGRRVGDTPEGLAPGLYIVRHLGKTEKRLVR